MNVNGQVSGLTVGSTVYPVENWGNDPYWTDAFGWVRTQPALPNINYLNAWTPPAKVRMKLSEVETLREAVRGNEAARAVLNKLAHLIEIEVDF